MAKLNKFADKVKKLKRKDVVYFNVDEGEVIGFEIQSLGQETMDKVNQKYDNMMPQVPTKRLPTASGKPKIVEDPDNKQYREETTKVIRQKMAELAVLFLAEDERPEGTIEEQMKALAEVELAGFIPKVVNRGLEISGLVDEKDLDEEIDEAKNN